MHESESIPEGEAEVDWHVQTWNNNAISMSSIQIMAETKTKRMNPLLQIILQGSWESLLGEKGPSPKSEERKNNKNMKGTPDNEK